MMLKVKGIIGTHKWGLYKDGVLVSTHNNQNNAIDAKLALLNNK